MHHGGDAGGPVKKMPIEAVRVVPKFLLGLKKDLVKKEAQLDDKFMDKFKNDFVDKDDDYDLENAQVVRDDDDYDSDPDVLPQIMPNHRNSSQSSDNQGKKNGKNEKTKKDEPVVNINEFHPTFKSKKAGEHKPEKTDDVIKVPEISKTSSKKSEEEKKTPKAEDKKQDSANQKRGLEAYVKDFAKEEDIKKKKVKTNLLSFNEDE